MGGILVGRREAVRNRLEAEVWEAVEGGDGSGPEEAFVVEVGVDKGDVEATEMEQLG